jgi:hypothetical protein
MAHGTNEKRVCMAHVKAAHTSTGDVHGANRPACTPAADGHTASLVRLHGSAQLTTQAAARGRHHSSAREQRQPPSAPRRTRRRRTRDCTTQARHSMRAAHTRHGRSRRTQQNSKECRKHGTRNTPHEHPTACLHSASAIESPPPAPARASTSQSNAAHLHTATALHTRARRPRPHARAAATAVQHCACRQQHRPPARGSQPGLRHRAKQGRAQHGT